jgi:hypothetical protein
VLEHSYPECLAQNSFLDALRADLELSLTNYGKFFPNVHGQHFRAGAMLVYASTKKKPPGRSPDGAFPQLPARSRFHRCDFGEADGMRSFQPLIVRGMLEVAPHPPRLSAS